MTPHDRYRKPSRDHLLSPIGVVILRALHEVVTAHDPDITDQAAIEHLAKMSDIVSVESQCRDE